MWDGVQWVSTLSPDGRLRWDGRLWMPLQGAGVPAPRAEHRASRQPTSWTRPLQYAIAAYYGLAALYTASLPFAMGPAMTQIVNQSVQRQQSLYPNVSPPPAGFTDMMNAMLTFFFAIGAVIGFAICVVGLIAALRRWTWAYYVIMAFFGLGMIALPLDIVYLLAGSAISSFNGGIAMPSWLYIVGLGAGVIDAALFVWMLVALVKRGPWAMKRVEA